jgi:dsDNA-specific endonuclease/ATPase MutS2
MTPSIGRVAGIAVTAACLVGALVIGGGVPPSPARIATAARGAARNAGEAARNTEETVRRTRALAAIARNVHSQLQTSRRMLRTQALIETASRAASERAHELARRIGEIDRAVSQLASELRGLQAASDASGETSEHNARAAEELTQRLAELQRLFDRVTEESRELNRKARAYARARGES